MLNYITTLFKDYKNNKQLAKCVYNYLLVEIRKQKIYTHEELKRLIDMTLLLECKEISITKINYKLVYATLKHLIFKKRILHITYINITKKIIISKLDWSK
jgi:hypothetical protein